MSTRASVIIKDAQTTLYFYRHSDGYPKCAGNDLAEFVKDYTTNALRPTPTQSAGWLIVRGHFEYKEHAVSKRPNPLERYDGWKVGAYEPTTELHGDVEYIYIVDLDKMELSCRVPGQGFWDKPTMKNTCASKEFETISFGESAPFTLVGAK